MSSRRLFLVVAVLFLLSPVANVSHRASADVLGDGRIYLPLVRYDELPPSFVGLFSTCCTNYANPDFRSDVYTIRADGSRLTRLTDGDQADENPRWSADGTLVLWQRGPHTYDALDAWLMNSDGSNPRDIGRPGARESAQWAPVGHTISIREQDPGALLLANADNGSLKVLVEGATLGDVKWSPTGRLLGYAVLRTGGYDLYTATADGAEIRLLAKETDGTFSWSPDGVRLLYGKVTNAGRDLYIALLDGSGVHALVEAPGNQYFEGWIANGAKVLVRDAGTQPETFALAPVVGGPMTPFAAPGENETLYVASVSPDGSRVVMVRRLTPNNDWPRQWVEVQAADSREPTPISPVMIKGCASDGFWMDGWSFDGRKIAFSYYCQYSPSGISGSLFVARVDGATPTYKELDGALLATWLPGTDWLSVSIGWKLVNTRTGTVIALPLPAGQRVVMGGWRPVP